MPGGNAEPHPIGSQSLDLSYTTFNDSGMKTLQGLRHLRRLALRDTLITDEGLRSIEDLTGLEEIDLYGVKVTDAGITALRKLTALKKLRSSRRRHHRRIRANPRRIYALARAESLSQPPDQLGSGQTRRH